MLDYIKERIALIMLLVAGDSISLITFIKAPEIRTECTSLAAAISLLLMLMISLSVIYLLGPMVAKNKKGRKRYMALFLGAALLLWVGFIFSYIHFSGINDPYGKISFSRQASPAEAGDSTIVGGCAYTPEAQREVDAYVKKGRTLTTLKLLGDFNMDTAKVWTEDSRDCARKKIILSFSVMIAFLVAGLTLTYEFIALAKPPKPKAPPAGILILLFLFATALALPGSILAMPDEDEHPTLAIGAAAPDFSLPGVDGKTYSLQSFAKARVLVIVFMCNHCPTSQAYEGRMIQMTRDYAGRGVQIVAINPNNPASLRLDELGYSDLGDSYEEMKVRARDAGFNFPYLYDGETEAASKKYGPVSTPHIFIFDEQRRLRYNGRVDDTEDPGKPPRRRDAIDAIEALLHHQPVSVPVTRVFGCSVKWIGKKDWIRKAAVTWAKEPVDFARIDLQHIRELMKNKGKKLLLINIWATWCVPCVQEFPELVTINRMYRDRGLELVTISTDDSAASGKAFDFLKASQCSSPNFRFTGGDIYSLIEAVDPKWQGALPYTLLVEPGGKIAYAHQGAIDPEVLKKIIFEDPLMGRIYK